MENVTAEFGFLKQITNTSRNIRLLLDNSQLKLKLGTNIYIAQLHLIVGISKFHG